MEPSIQSVVARPKTRKDYQSDQEVRWCPGCGDYAVLAQFQKMLASIGARKEDHVIVSGIGCSSRFPYYVDCYGLHSIHGRAPAIATGIKLANPRLTVWVVTGDGDGLSIGIGHLLHALRRNVDIKILLFNNRIYGLTKGQASPTSPAGLTTRSTPAGNGDAPVNAIQLAIDSGATFVARVRDTDTSGLKEVLEGAAGHRGAAFVEIYQNCPVFNDGAFNKPNETSFALYLKAGQSLIVNDDEVLAFTSKGEPCLRAARGSRKYVHDPADRLNARRLANLDGGGLNDASLPVPFGILLKVDETVHHDTVRRERRKSGGLEALQQRLGAPIGSQGESKIESDLDMRRIA
ncbi:MAG: 2-oxoglutarate ferredoxin oxidoreductase subunit beta [marine bacterium B5-7]|nr:MAG: 2-oxoglutarate ferredoxin oxidoreductase subunit beta [marine bacterium B5-7]